MIDFDSWILPFTFIPAVAMLVMSTANRLFYVSSLIREIVVTKNHIYAADMENLIRRIYHFHRALIFFYVSVGLLAISALIGSLSRFLLKNDSIFTVYLTEVIVSLGIISVIIGTFHLIKESVIALKLTLNCKQTKEIVEKLQKEDKV